MDDMILAGKDKNKMKCVSSKIDIKDLGKMRCFLDQDRYKRQQTSGSWTPTREREQALDQPLYQSVVGSLMYLATFTRPDIAYAVGMLAPSPTKVTGLLRNVCCVT